MMYDEDSPFGPDSLEAVRSARRDPQTPRAVIAKFTGPDARLVPGGTPEPRLVRSAVAAVRRAVATLATDAVQMGALGKFVDGAVAIPAGNVPAGPSPLVHLAGRLALVGAITAFSIALPSSDAKAWDGQRQFGMNGQRTPPPGLAAQQTIQRPVGNPGYGGGYGPDPAAVQVWRERREIRRERREDNALLGTGALVAGALIGGGLANNNYGQNYYGNGYQRPYPVQPPYPVGGYGYPVQGYQGGGYPGGGYPNPGYQGGGYGGGYRQARVPSDTFVIAAKTLIAARLAGTSGPDRIPGAAVHEADRIIDTAIYNGVACVRQMNGGTCVARTHGVEMDFVTGHFIAGVGGIPSIEENNGSIRRLRPDLLEEAYARSKADHRAGREMGMGGAAPGY